MRISRADSNLLLNDIEHHLRDIKELLEKATKGPTELAEARNQALEDAAKVMDGRMIHEQCRRNIGTKYNVCQDCARAHRAANAIRALKTTKGS